jgi:LytS/YehU family sensor histidine kinase
MPRVLAAHAMAALVSAGLWYALGSGWAKILVRTEAFPKASATLSAAGPWLVAVGVLLWLAMTAAYYLIIAFQKSSEAEKEALQASVLLKEAELRALRMQINPHFLFNSLNSISALTAVDPPGARRMCVSLADFFRTSLALANRPLISVEEELSLVEAFLSIEQVRFGSRLKAILEVEDASKSCAIPSLSLQPLVENAVRHGINGLVEGGAIRLAIRVQGSRLIIDVENPRDPEHQSKHPRRRGLGLDNVRGRLRSLYGPAARLETVAQPASFRATLTLPAESPAEARKR